jgi:hypothetical protein
MPFHPAFAAALPGLRYPQRVVKATAAAANTRSGSVTTGSSADWC